MHRDWYSNIVRVYGKSNFPGKYLIDITFSNLFHTEFFAQKWFEFYQKAHIECLFLEKWGNDDGVIALTTNFWQTC